MAVLLFDGWDLHAAAYSTSGVTIGVWDYQGSPFWSHGTLGPTPVAFVAGKNLGRALEYRNTNTIFRTTAAGSSPIYRISWWGRHDRNIGTPSGSLMLIFAEQGSDSFRTGLAMIESGGNQARLKKFSGSTDFSGTFIGDSDIVTFSSEWAHYELYLNATLNQVRVYQNGELIADADGELTSSANFTQIGIHAPGATTNNASIIQWDHLVVTNSATSLIDTTGIHAVAVAYSANAKDTTSNLAIRGRLVINGTDYFSSTHSIPTAEDGYGPRSMGVYYNYFMTNPDTSAAWSGAITEVEAWGICRTDDTGGHAYFANAALTYVEMVDGYPQVLYLSPTADIILDGTWQKTHGTDFFEHVDNFPRTNPPYDYSVPGIDSGVSGSDDGPDPFNSAEWAGLAYDDLFFEDYISVTGPGCLVFGSPDEEEPEPEVFDGIGLTFAEEYRENYNDWETIDGVGEDFLSYFITGYRIHGDGDRPFMTNYITVNYETHESGGALIQGVWDYALNGDTNRWGSAQQIYFATNDVDYKHAFRKLKIRGQGKAMQMRVRSQTGQPFFINGWSIFVSTNELT